MEEKEQYGAELIKVLEGQKVVKLSSSILLLFAFIICCFLSCQYIDGQKQGSLEVTNLSYCKSHYLDEYLKLTEEYSELYVSGIISLEEYSNFCTNYSDSLLKVQYTAEWSNDTLTIVLHNVPVRPLYTYIDVKCIMHSSVLYIMVDDDGTNEVNTIENLDLKFDIIPIVISDFEVRCSNIAYSKMYVNLKQQESVYIEIEK